MAERLTAKFIQNTVIPGPRPKFYYDTQPGLAVRITANGVVAFVLDYRKPNASGYGRYTIGRWPEWTVEAARNEAQDLRRKIYPPASQPDAQPFDPLTDDPNRGKHTMSDLADRYLEWAKQNKREGSIRNDKRMLAKVRRQLGTLLVHKVTRSDIEDFHYSIREHPPTKEDPYPAGTYEANRSLSLLSKMFTLAMSWGWMTTNPCKGITRFEEEKRESYLKEDQIGALERALDDYVSPESADIVRLALLTGSRIGEVLGARWEDIDLDRGVWTKLSHHTKQKKTEHIPLNGEALRLLKRLGRSSDSQYLFPGEKDEDGKDVPRVSVWKCWVQVCRKAGLATPLEKKGRKLIGGKPLYRIHDLRHTFCSHLVQRGESLVKVGKLVGHARAATTERYAHLATEALQGTTELFGDIYKQASKPQTKPQKGRKRA